MVAPSIKITDHARAECKLCERSANGTMEFVTKWGVEHTCGGKPVRMCSECKKITEDWTYDDYSDFIVCIPCLEESRLPEYKLKEIVDIMEKIQLISSGNCSNTLSYSEVKLLPSDDDKEWVRFFRECPDLVEKIRRGA